MINVLAPPPQPLSPSDSPSFVGMSLSGQLTNSFTSLASTPAGLFTGSWFTGGSGTTTKPHLLVEPTGATSTGWNTSGTGLGVNAASGFAGNLMDLQLNGSSLFRFTATGRLGVGANAGSPAQDLLVERDESGSDTAFRVRNNHSAGRAVMGVQADLGTSGFYRYGSAYAGTIFGLNQANMALFDSSSNNSAFVLSQSSSTSPFIIATNNAERLRIDKDGNVGIKTTSFGTSAAGVLGIGNGTAPSTSPADMVQIFSVDISAGNASLGLNTETAVAADAALASTHTLKATINGTIYKILLATP